MLVADGSVDDLRVCWEHHGRPQIHGGGKLKYLDVKIRFEDIE